LNQVCILNIRVGPNLNCVKVMWILLNKPYEEDGMNYSESAEGIMITKERAIQEIRKHGHPVNSPEYQELLAWVNEQDEIDAGDLLRELGY